LTPVYKRLEKYESKRLTFTHHVVDGGEVLAPRREFTHSVVHLLDNAFKFSPQNGKVHLEINTGPNGGIKNAVFDDGPGIPLDQREKVFEKFYQISQGDTRAYEGLGVGLTIARAVFQNIGGSIKIIDFANGCLLTAELPDVRAEDIVYGR
jgi:signal transduction histidine kinase